MGVEDGKSRLQGKSLEQPASRGVGKSLDTGSKSTSEELSELTLTGRVIVQRDSRREFKVDKVHIPDMGSDKRLVANLEALDGGGDKMTLGTADLVEKLKTSGSPWRLKE